MSQTINRRLFLRTTGTTLIGVSLIPMMGCEENLITPLVEGSDLSFLTPLQVFYSTNGGESTLGGWQMPDVQANAWQLTIDGEVSNPLTFTYQEILNLVENSGITALKTMRCIFDNPIAPTGGGNQISNGLWRGIPLKMLLDQAGINLGTTKRLRFYGADGFNNNLMLEQVYPTSAPADRLGPFLATHLNGEVLPRKHGFPLRLISVENYGFKNIKWLERIEATTEDTVFGQYQDVNGFSDTAPIQVVNKVTNPLTNEQVPAGTVRISGHAMSGDAGIAKVEISFDQGTTWEETRIVPIEEFIVNDSSLSDAVQVQNNDFVYPFPGVWCVWTYDWNAPTGQHTILVRATDRNGATQPVNDNDPFDGQNRLFELSVSVV